MDDQPIAQEPWVKLNNLKELYEHGFISKEEFEERKGQIVDELTGTSSRTSTSTRTRTRLESEESFTFGGGGEGASRLKGKTHSQKELVVIARPPPDFEELPLEKAMNHIFNPETRKWTQKNVWVKIEGEPFAKGSMRLAFHSLIIDQPTPAQIERSKSKSKVSPYLNRNTSSSKTESPPEETNVLKMSINPFEDKNTPFRDVETQMYSRQWAERFNRYDPPKRIDFIACSILELIERPNQPICTVEQFIAGPYRKHNNNWGYVSEDERNTPQAFSHFTYHASNGTMLICDIQGVGDLYTDPQIHTLNVLQQKGTTGFGGRGNLGIQGFEKFLRSHRCNAICRYFRLPPVNAKEDDKGTLPNAPVMQYGRVEIVNVHISSNANGTGKTGAGENTPLIPKEELVGEEIKIQVISLSF